ncbi:MAG: transposase [Gammaproteobacteria bacterium]|nr:transposase [Gammaproteobacteria bacterium]
MSKQGFRQSVSIPGLLKTTRQVFEQIPDSKSSNSISLTDHLMSGLAIFGLKYPSLLQFDQDRNMDLTRSNLKSLYGIKKAPSDTYLRERLDEVDPASLRKNYTQLLQVLQRGKGLEGFAYLDNHYLLSLDGTGYFSSNEIHCDQCGEKHHRDGRVSYYHQLLGAVLVHPDHKEVFPLAPEPILKQDGSTKNDCERNAAKRFLNDTRREHPHMKFIVIEDALASNAPHIKLLQALNYRYLLGAKQADHKFLFDWVDNTSTTVIHELIDEKGVIHRFRYLNNAPLNDANFELEINFLEYWEIKPNGKTTHFSWVTDILITQENLVPLMRGARARWKVENETFNTLKNHGYHFEHNFGHGYHHLSTVMVHLMMLAFLIDQIQQRCCGLFNRALDKAQSKIRFWQKIRNLFQSFLIPHWEAMYLGIANELKPTVIPYNTS